MLGGQSTRVGEVAGRQRPDPGLALQRLEEERRHLVTVDRERGVQRVGVRERHELDTGGQRLERLPVRRLVRECRAPIDRPWNDPSSARIRGRSVPPLRRASLNAASLASVPELVRNTREPSGAPARPSSRSANAICVGLPKKFET